jgi:predicted transcriptional regulator
LANAETDGRVRVLRQSTVVAILEDSVTLDRAGVEVVIPNPFTSILVGGEPPEGFLRKVGVEIVEKVLRQAPSV